MAYQKLYTVGAEFILDSIDKVTVEDYEKRLTDDQKATLLDLIELMLNDSTELDGIMGNISNAVKIEYENNN
jgi:hypothetical protein